jgi:hypothetical protein
VTAGYCRPTTSKAMLLPYLKPMKDFGVRLTSQVRPLSRSAIALIVFSATSGFIPASELDGGNFYLHLRLDGGEREGPECIVSSLNEVFYAFTKDLSVISFSYGVLCNNLYVHRLLLM